MLAFVATMSTAAFAQTTPTKQEVKKDLRQDAKDIKQDRKKLKADIKNGDKTDAQIVRQDIKADKRDMRQDAKAAGIKHPRRHPRHRHH
jgi:hypothetical protein